MKLHSIFKKVCMTMSLSDKQPTENESLKRSREKQKKEDAWKPDGPFFYGLCLSISVNAFVYFNMCASLCL